MTIPRTVVPLSARMQGMLSKPGTVTRKSYARFIRIRFIFGGILTGLAVIGAITLAITADFAGGLLPVLVVGGFGALLLWLAQQSRKHLRRTTDDAELAPSPRYILAVTPDHVELPGADLRPAETWDRAATTATVTGSRSRRVLRLEAPGKRPRTYRAFALGMTPEQVAELIRTGPVEPAATESTGASPQKAPQEASEEASDG